MSTNDIIALTLALKAANAPAVGNPYGIYIGMIVVALLPTLAALSVWVHAKAAAVNSAAARDSAKAAELEAKSAKKSSDEAVAGVKEVHDAVNSERTAMLAKVEKLRDEILTAAKVQATSDEKLRQKDERPIAGLGSSPLPAVLAVPAAIAGPSGAAVPTSHTSSMEAQLEAILKAIKESKKLG